jgi:hypothetical protein
MVGGTKPKTIAECGLLIRWKNGKLKKKIFWVNEDFRRWDKSNSESILPLQFVVFLYKLI